MGAEITAEGLVMTYGDVRAVDGVSFTVASGEFFGLLGPNGAGKTTTLEMVEGLRKPQAGSVRIDDHVPSKREPELQRRMGVQLQSSSFFERLTAREQLDTFGALYGVAAGRTDEMLEQVGLVDKADDRTEDLSGGQKQRLSIACALIHDPDVVFLDEPTAALDPQARRNLWDVLRSINDSGRTVDPDDALHGRGRGAVRPRRDHGRRQDPRARHPRCTRTRARRPGTHQRRAGHARCRGGTGHRRLRRRRRRGVRPRRSRRATPPASSPSSPIAMRWTGSASRAHRSRTSSSTSPGREYRA